MLCFIQHSGQSTRPRIELPDFLQSFLQHRFINIKGFDDFIIVPSGEFIEMKIHNTPGCFHCNRCLKE